ncbi:MAG: Gfo/Idh/MocA family oxidoreductase, partial [Lentisphaeria bacterium]|nr:Gfo/Idh/MocA family oxidoreductase [Lentisphaeria bacterium]
MNSLKKPLTAVLIGAGHRGHKPFGEYALHHPDELQFVAVVEPDDHRRERFARLHGISETAQFIAADQLYQQPRLADIIVNAGSDRAHVATTLPAFELGYHVLMEKPIAASSVQVLRFFEAAVCSRSQVWVMHELRWSPFFQHVKTLLEMNTIGNPVTWQHTESPAYWHMAHSYVRGNWRRQSESTPILLAKACHDLDLLVWLLARPVKQVHSFGSLNEFRPENAPENAPLRCTDGCPVA